MAAGVLITYAVPACTKNYKADISLLPFEVISTFNNLTNTIILFQSPPCGYMTWELYSTDESI